MDKGCTANNNTYPSNPERKNWTCDRVHNEADKRSTRSWQGLRSSAKTKSKERESGVDWRRKSFYERRKLPTQWNWSDELRIILAPPNVTISDNFMRNVVACVNWRSQAFKIDCIRESALRPAMSRRSKSATWAEHNSQSTSLSATRRSKGCGKAVQCESPKMPHRLWIQPDGGPFSPSPLPAVNVWDESCFRVHLFSKDSLVLIPTLE